MRSLKSLITGLFLVIAYALLDSFHDLPFHQAMPWLPLASVAAIALVHNPLSRRLRVLRPFDRSEIAIVATMVLVATAVIGAGIPARIVGLIIAFHGSHAPQEQRLWDERISPAFPDHLCLSRNGAQQTAADYRDAVENCRRQDSRIQRLRERQTRIGEELDALFRRHLQMEAQAYGCQPEDIAAPRRRQEKLTRDLIQLTRTINELKTDPRNEQPRTLSEAIALNSQMARLNRQKTAFAQELAEVARTLERIMSTPRPEDLPKIAAVKQEIQARQATLTRLAQDLQQAEASARSLEKLAGNNRQIHRMAIQAAQNHIEALRSHDRTPKDTPDILRLGDMMNRIPWSLWLPPLLAWGTILGIVIVIVHNLAILLTRQWTVSALERPDFPLAHILRDALPTDERHGGLDLLHRPSFYLGAAVGAAWFLAARGLHISHAAFAWQGWMPTQFKPAAAELVLAFSLPVLATAVILPRRLTASLWSLQLLVGAAMALAAPAVLSFGENPPSPADLGPFLAQAKQAIAVGAAGALSVFLLLQASTLLFCAFYPYDIPHTKRAERRDLTHASAYLIAGAIALFLALNLVVGLTMGHAALALALILTSMILTMRLSAETGFLTSPGLHGLACPSIPIVPLGLLHALFATPAYNPLPVALPQAVRLRNDTRTNYSFYQLAVILSAFGAIAVATCSLLALAYAQQLPQKCLTAMAEIQALVTGLVADRPGPRPQAMLYAGGTAILAAYQLLRKRLTWLPSPIVAAFLCLPFLEHAWLSIFLGWCLATLLARHASPIHQERLRCAAIGVLMASLLLGSLLP